MFGYIVRRLVTFCITLFGIVILTFMISHIIPGDPAALAAGPTATRATVEALREDMGLNKPLVTQFVDYLQGITQLDFGRSIMSRRPVSEDLLLYFPATLELVIVAFMLYLLLGIPLGIISALARGRGVDIAIRFFSIVGYATPLFVLALWLQYIFYYQLDLFPSGNRLPFLLQPPPRVTGFYLIDSLLVGDTKLFMTSLHHLVLPVISLSLTWLAIATRFTRASMLNELGKDYIKMARLKGLKPWQVVIRHALRNSLIPVITMTSVQFGYFIGGSVLIEVVYLWPGVGTYAFNSTVSLDYAPVMGVTLVTSFVFISVNLLVDLLYPVLDPRIKLTGAR